MPLTPQYVAGFFDGEGCVGLYGTTSGRGRVLRVQITQNCSPVADGLLAELAATWGGSMTLMNRTLRSPAWNWQVNGGKAIAFLEWIRPHLILKAPQADVALQWYRHRELPARDERGRVRPLSNTQIVRNALATAKLRRLKKGT